MYLKIALYRILRRNSDCKILTHVYHTHFPESSHSLTLPLPRLLTHIQHTYTRILFSTTTPVSNSPTNKPSPDSDSYTNQLFYTKLNECNMNKYIYTYIHLIYCTFSTCNAYYPINTNYKLYLAASPTAQLNRGASTITTSCTELRARVTSALKGSKKLFVASAKVRNAMEISDTQGQTNYPASMCVYIVV